MAYYIFMTPIKQIKNVRQRPEEGYRLWYANEFFDIILWYEEEDGFIQGFQFCYGKPYSEKAYTWEIDTRSHHYIKDGRFNATGMLQGDAGDLPPFVLDQFKKNQGDLPESLMQFIISKLTLK